MKKILLVGIMFLMFVGVVNASSVNGEFEGNPVVKLLDNGKILAIEDVPAIIYNDRTMVPIYLLNKMGVKTTWDPKNYSVDIKMPITTVNNNKDIDTIKFYSSIQFEYGQLMNLGDILTDLSNGYSLAYDGISLNRTDTLIKMNDRLNKVIEMYNKTTIIVDAETKKLWDRKIYDTGLVDVMAKYSKSIDFFKECDKYLNLYYSSRSSSDFNVYLYNSGKGFDIAFEGRDTSLNKYAEYYNLLQTY